MPRRSRRNVKQHACSKLVDGSVFHRCRCATGEHHAYMLDVATGGASRRTDVKRPLPARVIGSSTDGHPADVHNLELPFFKGASLIRLLKTLQNCLDGVHIGALPKRASENA